MTRSAVRRELPITIVLILIATSPAFASLRDALVPRRARSSPVIANAIQPLSAAIGRQVAKQIPTLSTSAGYTFEFNFATDVYERSATTFGPIFTERAVTIGRHKFNFNLSYSWISFDTYDGRDLDHIRSRTELARVRGVPGAEQPPRLFAGILDEQGYFTQLDLGLDLEAQLVEFSLTYGVLDDLDVNVAIPVLRTYARSELHDKIPEPGCIDLLPRCRAAFGHPPSEIPPPFPVPDATYDPATGFYGRDSAGFDSALGVGDMHVRAKYLAVRRPIGVAALLDLSLPTGSEENFQGTGDTSLLPLLILSRDVIGLLEIHSEAGINVTFNDIDRSEARYALGVTGQPFHFVAISVDFLGRSEFSAQGTIPTTARLPAVKNGEYEQGYDELVGAFREGGPFTGRPYFIDIHRNDILELAVGVKVSVVDRVMIFTNFLVPLNNDGLRADFVPTIGVEATF